MVTIIAIVVTLAALGYAYRNELKAALTSAVTTVETKGSAFARVAEHEAIVLETKGKIIALEAANKATNAVLTELEAATAAVHSERDAISSRLSALQASL